MERISQREHYDFESIDNFIRCKGHLESISDREEMCNNFISNLFLKNLAFLKLLGYWKHYFRFI